MSFNPVRWFEIYVQDMPRAQAFYEGMLQVRMTPLPNPNPGDSAGLEMLAFPMGTEASGCSGTLAKMPGMPSGGNSTLVYFACEDCAVEAGRAAANGGKVFKDKMPIGEHGFMALVTDTEGNMVGLHSMK